MTTNKCLPKIADIHFAYYRKQKIEHRFEWQKTNNEKTWNAAIRQICCYIFGVATLVAVSVAVAVVVVVQDCRGIPCDSIQICTIIIKFVCKIGVEC